MPTIAMRNVGTGRLMGCLPVPDGGAPSLDAVRRAFEAAYPTEGISPTEHHAHDLSVGLFGIGPLVGLWEWVDEPERPLPDLGPTWAASAYRQVMRDHAEQGS